MAAADELEFPATQTVLPPRGTKTRWEREEMAVLSVSAHKFILL